MDDAGILLLTVDECLSDFEVMRVIRDEAEGIARPANQLVPNIEIRYSFTRSGDLFTIASIKATSGDHPCRRLDETDDPLQVASSF